MENTKMDGLGFERSPESSPKNSQLKKAPSNSSSKISPRDKSSSNSPRNQSTKRGSNQPQGSELLGRAVRNARSEERPRGMSDNSLERKLEQMESIDARIMTLYNIVQAFYKNADATGSVSEEHITQQLSLELACFEREREGFDQKQWGEPWLALDGTGATRNNPEWKTQIRDREKRKPRFCVAVANKAFEAEGGFDFAWIITPKRDEPTYTYYFQAKVLRNEKVNFSYKDGKQLYALCETCASVRGTREATFGPNFFVGYMVYDGSDKIYMVPVQHVLIAVFFLHVLSVSQTSEQDLILTKLFCTDKYAFLGSLGSSEFLTWVDRNLPQKRDVINVYGQKTLKDKFSSGIKEVDKWFLEFAIGTPEATDFQQRKNAERQMKIKSQSHITKAAEEWSPKRKVSEGKSNNPK